MELPVKKYCLLTLFVFVSLFSIAQTTVKTEEREIFFYINYVLRLKDTDTAIVFIDEAKGLGIEAGTLVRSFQSSAKTIDASQPERPFKQVGSGRIAKADTNIICFIKLYNRADTLTAGDVISLKVNVPALAYRGIFSDLAFNKLEFTGYTREKFYSLNDLVNNDSRRTEDSLYTVLLNDLHNTYEKVKDRTNLPASLSSKITFGRYTGKTSLEVIRDAKRSDIESFLYYVNAYPENYRARDFRLSESFAGWIIFGGPYSPYELKKALFPIYNNKALFLKLLPTYKKDILAANYCLVFANEAQAFSIKRNYTDAEQLINFTKTLAIAVNDTPGKAIAYLYSAEINHYQDKYPQAIIDCDSSIKYSVLANNHEYELAGTMKKVYCLYKALHYTEAKQLLQQAWKKLQDYKPTLTEAVYITNLQKRYEYEGAINYAAGDYDQALKLYGEAIEINKGINSYESLIKNAQFFTFIGRVNNDQRKPSNALDSFARAVRIYRMNFDTLNWALVENDIAYSYYKMGNYRKSISYSDSAMQKLLRFRDYNNAGYSKSLMGNNYWELGQYDSAVLTHKESIALRKKANNLSGQASSWQKIGELYLLSGLKNQALLAYDSSAWFFKQAKDSSGLAETYNKKGSVYYNDENYKTAIEFFENARGINSKTTVEALYNLGNAWLDIDTIKARNYFTLCRRLSDSTKNTGYLFDATRALASLAYRTNNTKEGDRYYAECLLLSKQLNTAQSLADCLSLKAFAFREQTQIDSALFYYHETLQILDTVSQSGVIWQLNNMADVLISMGDFSAAKEKLGKAIEIAKATKNNLALGSTLQSTSFLYGLTGEFDEGLKNSDSALAIFQRSGNILRLGNTYLSRGTLYKSMGEYKKSINSFLIADSIFKDQQAGESRNIISTDIGVVYFTQEDYVNAIIYHRKALEQLKKGVIDENYLLCKGNIGEDLFYLKKNSEAEKELLEVFPVAKEKKLYRIASGMAISLGKIYYETKQWLRSADYFIYAVEIANKGGEVEKIIEALTFLGQINNDLEKKDSAENNFRKAITVVKEYRVTSGWAPYYQLGLLFYTQNKFDSALIYFKEAVELLDKNAENLYGGEDARKIFNNDPRKSDLYNKITFSYYNIGNIKEAWAYANRSNIAGIKELSGSLSATSSDAEKNEALKKLLAMQQSKKALENTLEKQEGVAKEETLKKIEILEADYNNFLQDVVVRYPELNTYFIHTNADEFNNYKSKLPKDVAVLLYLLNNKTLMIFSLTNEKLAVDTMTIDIGPKVNSFITSIKNTEKQTGTGPLSERSDPVDEVKTISTIEFKDVSSELYKILIASVDEKIKGKKKLCIIPTGIFSNMPFQCLGKNMPGNKFRFVIEDYSIFYTSKMSIFNQDKRDSSEKKNLSSFAAFGVPDATLHYNIDEVKEIGKILGSDSTVYTDARATESMAKQSLRQKKYIHFATHGVLNYSNYSESYLKLLPDKDTSGGNNGRLTMREIQRLGITDCNMVILSACQTAVSKQLVNGWNISPANSFLISNVKTVVASLWKVADEPTGLLMGYFYENLSQPKSMEKAEALRQAQIRLSQDVRFRHPNYWGAFVLYGDWQ